ncbi:MAG: lamin tail domain-containing protein [Bacteroidota bacterium]
MRKTLLLFMLLSVKLTFGQLTDDFSDGNFTANPSWVGQNSQFYVNANGQLQSALSSTAQLVSLSTANFLALNTQWDFFVQMNFDPSSSNQARIYLIADQQDLNGSLNGYFIQIGESGSTDSYDLFRQTGTTVTKIIDGAAKSRADVNLLKAKIKVTRDEYGKWELFTDITGASNFVLEGTATDLTHVNSDWFGVRCDYTATRSAGFIFDDFKIAALKPDVKPPTLLSAKALDEFNIEVVFSERLQVSSALMASNYTVTNLGNPVNVSNTTIANVYKLTFASALPNGENKLTVHNLSDLAGNPIVANSLASFFYLKPYTLKKGDILISEVLSNPRTGGLDFVEIYNNTNQILDLKDLQLANTDAAGKPANIKNVSTASVYMPAKTYWVLTTNPIIIQQHYDVKYPNQFVQMSSLPAFNNDQGSVVLLTSNGVLEQLNYNEKMHVKLLQNGDGVSLERISFAADANAIGNFKSAAQSVGFATPTAKNSQEFDNSITKSKVSIANKVFSPDDDGFEDVLKIDYNFITNGYVAVVNIYTDRGVLVRKLQRNTTIASNGFFTWDGLNDAGIKGNIGIYIIKFDAFTANGKMESFKQTCVLAAKLN